MSKKESKFIDNFKFTPTLASSRLVLKKITELDYSSIIDITMYDGATCKNEIDVKNIVEKIYIDVSKGRSLHWGIFLKESKKIIGVCGYYRGFENNSGEIGYAINESFRGKGFMSEAVSSLCDFGFEVLNLNTIVGNTDDLNEASQMVLKKNGFRLIEIDGSDLKFELILSTK